MAKAPQPGRAKTRLCPPLDPAQAADLGAAFLRDVTENIRLACQTVPIAGYVAFAPAGTEPLFHGLLAPGTGLVMADGLVAMADGIEGIGRSLLHATRRLLEAGHASVCLVNADSPTLTTRFLSDAAEALSVPGDRMVLGVAEDGGYYLIGLKAPHAAVFQDIAWSTDQVSVQTLQRAAALGLEVVTLPPWYDVDDAASLSRLAGELAAPGEAGGPLPFAAPATRMWFARTRFGVTGDGARLA